MKTCWAAAPPFSIPANLSRPAPVASGFRRWYRRRGKRILDLAGALILSVPAAVTVMGLSALIRRDGAPAIFSQIRIGRDGRPFRCWKLRTMVPDADRVLADLLATNPAARAEWAATRKLSTDPRITPLGHVLRRLSLDELPQIWNVLRGEMSLVGPRPIVRSELRHYGTASGIYLNTTPGMTGLWQVSGRNAVCYGKRVRLDVRYVQQLSLQADLSILIRTIGEVLRRSGC